MYEWRVNQIRLSMMERVLNHMERQGFEIQSIIPLQNEAAEKEAILAGRRRIPDRKPTAPSGLPAVTQKDIESIYER